MKDQPLVCVYCAKGTTKDEDLEHVVPEALGGRSTLYVGAVCTKCNHDLGKSVDRKIFKEAMIGFGQVATGTAGKRGPRTNIVANDGSVSLDGAGVAVRGARSGKDNERYVARFMAKISVNVLTENYGSVATRLTYPELISYVNMPISGKDIWPYHALLTALPVVPAAWLVRKEAGLLKPINPGSHRFAALRSASGLIAMPLRRNDVGAAAEAKEFIDEQHETLKAQGAIKTLTMTYTAKDSSAA